MIDEISKSIKADLYERVRSPLFGAFSFSWAVWNWRFLLVLFSDMKVSEKINYMDGTLYYGWLQPIFFLSVGPLISALLFIYLYPIPAKYVFKYTKEEQKKLKAIKVEVEDDTPLSQDEHNKLRQKITGLESSYYAELANKDSEIERLRSLVESASTGKSLDLSPKPQITQPSKHFPLSDTEQPVITEVKVGEAVYSLGSDYQKSRPGEVNVIKLKNTFNYQDKIDVSFKTNKPIIDGQFYEIFDGHSKYKTTDQNFQLHKTDYENKSAFVVVSQPNPSREGKDMVISNKVQFPY